MASFEFNLIRGINNKIFWRIDDFINCQPFRYIKRKFSLSYYNEYALIFQCIHRRYLDFIYTDGDLLLATWDASLFNPVSCHDTLQYNIMEKCDGIAVILLAITAHKDFICKLEAHLILCVLKNTITVAFLLLPSTRGHRLQEMLQIITEYDQLSDIIRDQVSDKIGGNVIGTVQLVGGTAAENTATIGIETTATSLGHAAAGVVLAVVVDLAVTASILARAKVRKDQGRITERQFKREIKERLFQTGCQFVAGTTGTIVGQLVLPVPVVGAAIGGFMGSLIGLGVSFGINKIEKIIERSRRRKQLMMLENTKDTG